MNKPTLTDVLAKIEVLRRAFPQIISHDVGGASATEVGSFFNRVAPKAPTSYRSWMQKVNGIGTRYDSIYGIPPMATMTGIEARLDAVPQYRAKGYLPIGDDGVGNDYILDVTHNNQPVLFFDASRGWDNPTEIVASSFSMFMMQLIEEAMYRERNDKIRWPSDDAYVLGADPDIVNFGYPLPWHKEK